MADQHQKTFKHELPLKLFINGDWVDSLGANFLTLTSAVDDSVVTNQLSSATADDIDKAVASCEAGLKFWQAFSLAKRRDTLLKFADLLVENADRLAYLEAIVTGKPVTQCREFEVKGCAESFRFKSSPMVSLTGKDYAGFIDKLHGDLTVTEDGFLRGVLHQPLGVCAAIIPFNSPLITFGMKAAAALATGNSIVVKTSEYNPFSALAVAALGIKAGLPPGALNVVCGAAEAGQALSMHMKIRKISFTGSPVIGRKVQAAAASSNLKRVTLELGGKSPILVFDDADIDSAVANTMKFLAFNGQGCILGTRVLVQQSKAEEFAEKVTAKAKQAASALGADPLSPTTMSSPMYHQRQRDTVLEFLATGKSEATLLTGGEKWGDKGLYIEPTVFYKPKKDAAIAQREIFGPVLVVDVFETEEEAVEKANDTEYGLGAYAFTSSIDRAIRLSKHLEAGAVAVNTTAAVHQTIPFGGWKSSGIGAENGEYVLRAYTQPKAITIKFSATP